jgi:hypothetical protein
VLKFKRKFRRQRVKTQNQYQMDLELRKKLVKCYIWSVASYGTGKLRAVDQKHLESLDTLMWCWRRMEKISWTDHVTNEEVLHIVKEKRNILHEISKRQVRCTCRLGSRSRGYHPVAPRPIAAGPFALRHLFPPVISRGAPRHAT